MGMFEMSEKQIADYREQVRGYAREKVTDEPIVVAPALFRRGGAATKMGDLPRRARRPRLRRVGPVLEEAGRRAARQGPARRHPDQAPRVQGEASRAAASRSATRWRSGIAPGVQASTEQKMGLTMLTLESPAEGEKVTIAPIGVKDDPVSPRVHARPLVDGVTEAPATAVTIHKQRGRALLVLLGR